MTKVSVLRGTATIIEDDFHDLRVNGISNEDIIIIYNSTHDKLQKLLLEEIAAFRGIELQPVQQAA